MESLPFTEWDSGIPYRITGRTWDWSQASWAVRCSFHGIGFPIAHTVAPTSWLTCLPTVCFHIKPSKSPALHETFQWFFTSYRMKSKSVSRAQRMLPRAPSPSPPPRAPHDSHTRHSRTVSPPTCSTTSPGSSSFCLLKSFSTSNGKLGVILPRKSSLYPRVGLF